MKTLIAVTILLSVAAAACGPSDEELLATALAATRSAESIVSTAIAATEQAAPTSTPTITPTFTPQPTETPSLTELQIQLLSGIKVEEDDLPSSFTEISPEELNFSESEIRGLMGDLDLSVGSIFTLFDDDHFQFLMGFTLFLPDRVARARFDADLRQEDTLLDQMASELAGSEITDKRLLPGGEDFGDTSVGFTISSRFAEGDPPIRIDVVAFRRGILAVFLFEMYLDGEGPEAPIFEVAQTLDTKIQNALE